MHKTSEEKHSGESASSHPESITSLNKGSPRSQLRDAVSLFLGFSFAFQVAPGTQNPTFQPLCWQRARLPPRSTLSASEWRALRKELLLRNVLGLNFLVAFSDWGEERQASLQTHAHTLIRDGRAAECFHHYGVQRAADGLGLKITERKKQETGSHTGINNDIKRGGETTAEILHGGLHKIFTLCQSDGLIQIGGKKTVVY